MALLSIRPSKRTGGECFKMTVFSKRPLVQKVR